LHKWKELNNKGPSSEWHYIYTMSWHRKS